MSSSGAERTALTRVVDTALIPVHAAVSRPAQRAYLGTAIFAATSVILLCVSTFAYVLFYYNYVPATGVERTVHLQFGNGHPHGIASLASNLVSLQPYDVSLFLHLPRSPANLAAGNFMIDLALLAPSTSSSASSYLTSPISTANASNSILALSRRPAILTYASPIIDTVHKLSGLPWYMLGWRRESEVLEIGMFEGIEFAKGWRNVPDRVQVIVEAGEKMQFYEVGVKMVARFGGLRYILYNHRILSYLFFVSTFFTVSLTSTSLAYFLFSSHLVGSSFPSGIKPDPSSSTLKLKAEPRAGGLEGAGGLDSASESEPFNPFSTSDLSDTSRTFPTLGRQMPLHFTSRNGEQKIKTEEDEERAPLGVQPLLGEADDEDEDDERDFSFRDSGIGTSLDDAGRGARRRRGEAGYGDARGL